MKKLILICCLLFSISLVGCGKQEVDPDVIDNRDNDRFITIKMGSGDSIYIDKETGVQYLYIYDGYGAGLTVLMDTDGKPLLYESKK